MSVSLRQLEAFQAVALLGSITRAAENLNISQPAMSRLLADFRSSVGLDLFTRKNGQLVTTQEARFLLSQVNQVLEGIQHIEILKRELSASTAGHLRIACLPGFATSHLPNVLINFLKDKPRVTVTLEPDRSERILEWITGQQYDCGITDSFAGHPAIESEDIKLRTVCIFPKGHKLSSKNDICPDDLVEEQIIHTRRDSPFFINLNQTFIDRSIKLNSWIETRQFTAACTFISQGKGVSIVSELDAMQFLDKDIEMRPFLPITPHNLSILRPIATKPSIMTMEFIQKFSESLTPFKIKQ